MSQPRLKPFQRAELQWQLSELLRATPRPEGRFRMTTANGQGSDEARVTVDPDRAATLG